jgi:hypothetical protein
MPLIDKLVEHGIDKSVATEWHGDLTRRLERLKDRKREIKEQIDALQISKATVQAEIDKMVATLELPPA